MISAYTSNQQGVIRSFENVTHARLSRRWKIIWLSSDKNPVFDLYILRIRGVLLEREAARFPFIVPRNVHRQGSCGTAMVAS